MVPLAYEDARDFCRRSHWLAYLPTAIVTSLFYCTLYSQIEHPASWGLHRIQTVPGAHGLSLLLDPAVIRWAVPWVGLAGLLVLEWLGLKLMPFLIAWTTHLVAADNPSQAQRRAVVLCLYEQGLGQTGVGLVLLAPISVLFTLRLFQQDDHSVPPTLQVFPVLVGIGFGVLFMCAKSGHHIGLGTKALLSRIWAVLFTISLVVYGMLGLRMIVAAIWSSLL